MLGAFMLTGALAPQLASAQQPAESAEVMAVVHTLFEGMRQADTLKIRSVFAEGARFALLGGRAGAAAIQVMPMDSWIAGVGRSGGTWDERIYEPEVRVDETVASFWAPYSFYVSGRLRHCGTDSFELLKGPGGWKITQVSDTEKMTGCKEVPPGGD
jgi:hypothetical protein